MKNDDMKNDKAKNNEPNNDAIKNEITSIKSAYNEQANMGSFKERTHAEIEKIKAMKGRVRREYIWDYYKIHIIGGAVLFFMLGTFVNDIFINPPPSSNLTIAWMSGFELHETLSEFGEVFYPTMVEDPRRETVAILSFVLSGEPQHDMAQHTRFAAMTAASDIDIVIGELTDTEGGQMLGISHVWMFRDLQPMLEEVGIYSEDLLFYETEYGPIAFAIPLDSSPIFSEFFNAENRFLAVLSNTVRYEEVLEALRLLWLP